MTPRWNRSSSLFHRIRHDSLTLEPPFSNLSKVIASLNYNKSIFLHLVRWHTLYRSLPLSLSFRSMVRYRKVSMFLLFRSLFLQSTRIPGLFVTGRFRLCVWEPSPVALVNPCLTTRVTPMSTLVLRPISKPPLMLTLSSLFLFPFILQIPTLWLQTDVYP